MTARCTNCGGGLWFRQFRGAKLSNHVCKCGGKYEILSYNVPNLKASEIVPTEGVEPDELGNLYPSKNRSGELFVHNRLTNKYIKIELLNK